MLPLAEGYSTTFRNFDVQTQKVKLLQLTVAGKEEITVPVGKFDTLSGRDFLRGWRLGQEDRFDSYGNPQSSEGHPGRGFYGRSGDDSGTGAVDKVSDVYYSTCDIVPGRLEEIRRTENCKRLDLLELSGLSWRGRWRMVVRIRRTMRMRDRVLFQLFHHHLNGLLQLRILSLPCELRIEFDFDVRCDAVVLHFPLPIGVPHTGTRCRDEAAVH